MSIRDRTRRARSLRRDATPAEQIMWLALRERYGGQWKIRRQHPIGVHIADFAIPARRLVIEIDGGQHAQRVDADTERTAALRSLGYQVVRFWNNEVLENLDGVMQAIELALAADAAERPGSSLESSNR